METLNNKYVRVVIFLVSNFLALAIGVLLMENGPRSAWYIGLNKAPWTPPGFMFGISWSLIMFCYAFYLAKVSFSVKVFDKSLMFFYVLQWLLNVSWNYTFFNQKLFGLGLLVLVVLWFVLLVKSYRYRRIGVYSNVLIVPYVLWMSIAVSLNAYVVLMN